MTPLSQSPQELQDALVSAFPDFANEVAGEGDMPEFGGRTLHGVVMDFASFFARGIDSWSDQQLRWLSEQIVAGMASGGSLGNAWDTCFLEHSRQLKINRRLAPWLAGAQAKLKG